MKFHAAAPGGWTNDPNALFYAGDEFVLLAQHREDSPTFIETGWGRFTSKDLLHWSAVQVVIPAERGQWAYSGSIVHNGGGAELFHTSHAPATSTQTQWRGSSRDGGASWARHELTSIPSQRARRDPFVFEWSDGSWRMLLARPCSWSGWETEPASHIEIWSSQDRERWELIGTFGPLEEPGALWEVPLLLLANDNGGCALIISRVDRRAGSALCSVQYWTGNFDGAKFEPDGAACPLDLGPDFYAAMLNCSDGWPLGGTTLVGWASSWNTARIVDWPGFFGGPISLPRRVAHEGGKLRMFAEAVTVAAFTVPVDECADAGMGVAEFAGDQPFTLVIEASAKLSVHGSSTRGELTICREADRSELDWRCSHQRVLNSTSSRLLRIFVDGPLVELFIEPDGVVATIVLPTSTHRHLELSCGGRPQRINWFTQPTGSVPTPSNS